MNGTKTDCSLIKQKMLFYVEDCTSSKVLFKGKHLPTKSRVWLVVSNDANNLHSPNISMVPIYTRTDAKLPTQVFFKNGDRNQVISCEGITCIPREMICTDKYIGTISETVWQKVKKALSVQFNDGTSLSNTDNINQILFDEDYITDKIMEIIQKKNQH